MNAGQIPGGKKERKQTRKTYYNRKRANSHSVDSVYKSNLEPNNTMKSEDILALKIHGLYNGSDSFSSDSGQSSFDEDYYKYKPQPLKIDRNRIIVIGTKTNTKQRFNAKHKTDRDLVLCKQTLGMRNHEKSSNGDTLISPNISVGEIKADDEIKKDNVLAKNHIEQRKNTNEIKPRSLAVSTSQGPNNKWTLPKSTEVLSNSDLNFARYPSQRGEGMIPDVAITQLLSSIASIESRQPKNEAQTNTSFSNNCQSYYYYGSSEGYLGTAAEKIPLINTSPTKKIVDESLKTTPVTQGKHKTVISWRQPLKPDLIEPCYVGPVQECWQFPSNNEIQPSWSKIETQTFKSSANISEQTAQLENFSRKILDGMIKNTTGSQEEPKTVLNSKQRGSQIYQQLKPGPANPYNVSSVPKSWQFPPSEDKHSSLSKNETQTDNSFAHTDIYSHIKSSQGKQLSNHTLNKPPASQKRNKIEISERENASKTNQHVPKKDSWDEQGSRTIHMVGNNETLVRRISPKYYTESNILTGCTRIPQGSNILRPDQGDVIVRQPRALPIVQTTQWSSAAVDEHAEDKDDKPEEIRKGYLAFLFCCCSRN